MFANYHEYSDTHFPVSFPHFPFLVSQTSGQGLLARERWSTLLSEPHAIMSIDVAIYKYHLIY